MIRTQISLDPAQKQMLDMLSSARGKSMSELVRQALDLYIKYQEKEKADKMKIIQKLAGAWANSPRWKNIDAVKWQRGLRHGERI